jgi:hypothetical protein
LVAQVSADEELERLREFPEVSRDDLVRFFTLASTDVHPPGRGGLGLVHAVLGRREGDHRPTRGLFGGHRGGDPVGVGQAPADHQPQALLDLLLDLLLVRALGDRELQPPGPRCPLPGRPPARLRGHRRHLMATLRNLALGLLRLAGVTHIKRTLEHIAADRTRIVPIFATAIRTI